MCSILRRSFFVLLAAAILVLSSCSGVDKAEADFVDSIRVAVATDKGLPADYDSMHSLIDGAKPNLIFYGTVTERGECFYENGNDGAILTPYSIAVNEVYLGEINKAGDTMRLDARYGKIGDDSYRTTPHPIFEVGKSYVFFVRYDIINGSLIPYLASGVYGAIEANHDPDTLVFPVEGSFLDAYNGSAVAMVKEIMELVEANEYDTSIGVIGE